LPERRLVAIHQPNFFPWLGFFDKVRRVDVMIAMDNVQFSKTGGTWSNRVKVLVAGRPAWLTVPIVRAYHGTRTIAEMEIDNHQPWREKMLKTIELNYRRAPRFAAVFPWLADLIANRTDRVVEFNLHTILSIMKAIQLDQSKLVTGSDLQVNGHATNLLIDMVRTVGGTAYLVGGGADDYQQDELLTSAGIEVVYQAFQHPIYPQFSSVTFVPGLSIVDALMNLGFDGTAALLSGNG
jgi:hypothetical protein